MKEDKKPDTGSNTISTKDTSSSRKSEKDSLNSNFNEVDPMKDLDKEKVNREKENETTEIESENVKVAKVPGSTLMKVYYWKKENVTFLAVGQIGVEKRQGDQIEQIQKEYSKLGTDQTLKIIAAMIQAQETLTTK